MVDAEAEFKTSWGYREIPGLKTQKPGVPAYIVISAFARWRQEETQVQPRL